MFTVEFEGLDELRTAFREAEREVTKGIVDAVGNAVKEGADYAKRVHVYQDRTGDLTRSIHGEIQTAGIDHVEGQIKSDASYASYVEDGTQAHVIEPKRAKALAWEGSDGPRFARRVNHPGTRPHPFMGPALQQAERTLVREGEVAVASAAKILERE
jgi:HK97 gp10 family phage protein